jgi:flagellar biosynthesis/type III secretory pathway protein FliH
MTIPAEALTATHTAILGTTGAGKTSVSKTAIIEPLLEDGRRVLIIDPTAAHWGLRLAADGKKPGFKVYIFGGDHGDYPLRPSDAGALAEAFGRSSDSAIFDTSLMTVKDRCEFFIGFAETILRKNRGPLNLVIDEAHLFMPQAGAKVGGQVPAMLHAGNNLVSLGRSKGLRVTLITQRPAKLHKDSLTQAQALIAMRVMHPRDREAIAEWIAEQADPVKGKEIVASLAALKAGEAWVWAPMQDVLERVQFPMPKTFDSSKAPEFNAGEGPTLTPIDMEALKGKLATIETETRANDPKMLKAELAQLRRQMADAAKQKIVADPKAVEIAYDDGYKAGFQAGKLEGHRVGLGSAEAAMRYIVDGLPGAVNEIVGEAQKLIDAHGFAQEQDIKAISISSPSKVVRKIDTSSNGAGKLDKPVRSKSIEAHNSAENINLTGPQRQLLKALAWWKVMGHDRPSRPQVAAIAGWRITSGHLKNVVGSLNTAGLVTYPAQGVLEMTPAGAAAAPEPDLSVTLHEGVRSVLSTPQKQIFDTLMKHHGGPMPREAIAQKIGWEPTSGHLKNVIGSLRTLEVVEYPAAGQVALANWVMG